MGLGVVATVKEREKVEHLLGRTVATEPNPLVYPFPSASAPASAAWMSSWAILSGAMG